MKSILYLMFLLPLISCGRPKTEFGKIMEKSCLFLDTVHSLQFDRTFTRLSSINGDTETVNANVYLEYFDIGERSNKYTGLIQVYDQSFKDNAIVYKRELTKDNQTFFFYQDGKMQQNTEKVKDNNFGDEQCEFLNAKSLRDMIQYREKHIDHFSIKDTSYNGTTCYYIDLFLKDSPDADINKVHESFILRKADYMPLSLSFYGEISKGVIMYDRYEVSNIHINNPYNDGYINVAAKDAFLSNIDQHIVDLKIVESPLPFSKVPLKYMNGATTSLDHFKGKVVVLDFWYRGCFYCLKLMPELNRLSTKYKDVVFLGVDSRDSTSMITEYLTKNKFIYQTIDDSKQLETKLKVTGFPTTIIIGKDGKIHSTLTGFSTEAPAEIETKIKELY